MLTLLLVTLIALFTIDDVDEHDNAFHYDNVDDVEYEADKSVIQMMSL